MTSVRTAPWAAAPPDARQRFVDGDPRLDTSAARAHGPDRPIVRWLDRARVLGVLMVAFALHQLYVTDYIQDRSQDALRSQFAASLAQAPATEPTPPPATVPAPLAPVEPGPAEPAAPTPTTTGAPAASVTDAPATAPAPIGPSAAPPDRGDAVALLAIPAIGVDEAVVEGVEVPDLRRGPGHVPGTPLPGQQGNAVIAGHRTTYGAPFAALDRLVPGDEILVRTLGGGFVYVVTETTIVRPWQVEVVEPFGDDRLTLITCHPRYSARERLVVIAHFDRFLTDDPVPEVPSSPDVGPGASASTLAPPPAPAASAGGASPLPPAPVTSVEPIEQLPAAEAAAGSLLAEAALIGPVDLGSPVGLLDDTSALWPITGWGLVAWLIHRQARRLADGAGHPALRHLALPIIAVVIVPWFEAISHALPSSY